LRIRLSAIPVFIVIVIGLFYALRLHDLFDSYSRLIISRKPRDSDLVVRSLKMTEQAGSKRTAAENLAELTTDIHRNTTFLLFSLGSEYPDRIIQPKNELSSDAVRVAIIKWNDTLFGGDLYGKGITYEAPPPVPR
jgi:hypothetical protein